MQLRVTEHSDNMPGEILLDFPVSGNGLGHASAGISIPIVLALMPNQGAAQFFEGFDQVMSFHDTTSSSTLRIPAIYPPEIS